MEVYCSVYQENIIRLDRQNPCVMAEFILSLTELGKLYWSIEVHQVKADMVKLDGRKRLMYLRIHAGASSRCAEQDIFHKSPGWSGGCCNQVFCRLHDNDAAEPCSGFEMEAWKEKSHGDDSMKNEKSRGLRENMTAPHGWENRVLGISRGCSASWITKWLWIKSLRTSMSYGSQSSTMICKV